MKWALDRDVLTLPRALEVINELKSKLNWYFHYFSSPYAPRSWQSKCSMTVFYYCIYTGSTMWRETNSFQRFLPYIVNLFSLSPEAFALVPPSYTKCLLVPVPWHAGHCNIGHEKTIPFYMSYNAGGLQGAGFFLYLFGLVFCCFTQYIGFFCSRLFNHPAYFSKNLKHQMIIVHVMLLSCTLVHFSALHLYFHF